MSPVVYCACACHRRQLNERVDVNDQAAALTACERCSANHVLLRYVPEQPHRKQGFDFTEPFQPPQGDTSTSWNDDQGDGQGGRDNAP